MPRTVGVKSTVGLTTEQCPSEVSLCFSVLKRHSVFYTSVILEVMWYEPRYNIYISYLPTPPLGQDMTQGQFLSGVYIYIVIHRRTVSLYHNSSVWVDT